jgi:cytochrome c oxidase assembly protein subunit 15
VLTTLRRPVTGPVFRWFALASFISMILIALTGAAVRLTGSGLGCPDWPTCFRHRITGSLSVHPAIEYANRFVTVALFIVVALTLIAAWRRETKRPDLVWLSAGLVLGIIVDAVLGAFVVYSKLNPYLVSLHLIISLALIGVAALLYHHAKYLYGPGARADVRNANFLRVAQLLWLPFFVLVLTGTATTGSGPHAGNFEGQLVARRLPFALSSATWVHSLAATLFVGLVLGLLLAVYASAAPSALQLGVRRLVYISLVQAAIGVSQYLSHLPVWLVELHVAGAVSLTIALTQFNVRQYARDREPGTKKVPTLVETMGIEPTTSGLQSPRSTN